MKYLAFVALAALVVAGAWAADVAVAHGGTTVSPVNSPVISKPGFDATMELKWDNGNRTNGWAWYTGADSWLAQEFDVSTINTYNYVTMIRFNTYPNWPNSTYEGGRVGIYAFSGGSPGSILWGPEYRANTGGDWNDLDVGFSLGSQYDFLAAWEQFYNYPNCDSWAVSGGDGSHCWYYYNGWTHSSQFGVFMIRAVVDDSYGAVAPASLGSVKALYY